MGVALGQLAAAGERRAAADRDMGVLGHEQRIEAAILERAPELGEVDSVVGGKIESPYAHRTSPLHLLLSPTISATLNWPRQGHNEPTGEHSHDVRTPGRMVLDRQVERIPARRSGRRRREGRLFGPVVSQIARLRIDVIGGLPALEKHATHHRQLDRQHLCARFLYRAAGHGFAERSLSAALHPRPRRQPHSDGRGPARPSLRQAALGHARLSRRHPQGSAGGPGSAGDGRSPRPEDAGASAPRSRWARSPTT